ncbi:hypothetical protein vseg_008582 [Gypsophila vaccaria]
MGTLIGHVGPGFGFMLIGLWHLYNHLKTLAQNGSSSYKSKPWFPCILNNSKQHGAYGLMRRVELYLIICGCTLSVAMELFIGPAKHHPLDADGSIPTNHLHNFEHASISMSFLVYALFALGIDIWASAYSTNKQMPITIIMPAQEDVVQVLGGLAFGQQLLLFHLHSADHMGVEGQYHWLLQLVVFVSLATTLLGVGARGGATCFVAAFLRSLSIMLQGVWLMVMGFALWTPGLVPKGCYMKVEEGHTVVRCDGEESLHRAKALVNIHFSWLLIMMALFAAASYVFMMFMFGNHKDYSPMMSFSDDDHLEAPTHKINPNSVQSQGLLNTNPAHHLTEK